jgi:hypothetical protein
VYLAIFFFGNLGKIIASGKKNRQNLPVSKKLKRQIQKL